MTDTGILIFYGASTLIITLLAMGRLANRNRLLEEALERERDLLIRKQREINNLKRELREALRNG